MNSPRDKPRGGWSKHSVVLTCALWFYGTKVFNREAKSVGTLFDIGKLYVKNEILKQVNGSLFFRRSDLNSFPLLRYDPRFRRSRLHSPPSNYAWFLDDDIDNGNSATQRRSAPAQIVLTNFGWNSNSTLAFPRGIRGLELLQGIVNHPWFHPSAFYDIDSGRVAIDPSVRYYIFLDMDTCGETNYPVYGGDKYDNSDLVGNRTAGRRNTCYDQSYRRLPKYCPGISRLRDDKTSVWNAASKLHHNIMLVFIQCAGDGPRFTGVEVPREFPFAIASLSASEKELDPAVDLGQPSPAVKPIQLTKQQEGDIEICNETSREIFLSFVGSVYRGEVRKKLLYELSGGETSGVDRNGILFVPRMSLGKMTKKTYHEIMEQSVFALAPRGDNLFSYRFPEVLSAGAIPVVHADGWVWPFRNELVDWRKCAVGIAEEDINKTMEILRTIDANARCKMRQYCYELWLKYHKNATGTIAGLIESLELTAMHNGGSFPDLANKTHRYFTTAPDRGGYHVVNSNPSYGTQQTQQISGFDHLYWRNLPDEARAAAVQLGFNESSWDKDVYPSIFQKPVDEWSLAQVDAVKFLKLEEHATLIPLATFDKNKGLG